MSTTTLSIGGSPISLSQWNLWPARLSLRLKGYSTLTLVREGFGALPGLPDPWLGKTVELEIDGDLYFAGDVTDAEPDYTSLGWVISYQCRDLRFRGDRVPFTDSNTLTDSAAWNLPGDDLNWLGSRAGKTVGEILEDALTMDANANALDAKGIGGYTSLSPPTLPSATLADLALLATITPNPARVQGEKLLSAIDSFVSSYAPNHAMWVQPDGVIRFLDMRATTNHTFTMEDDLIEPTPIRRLVGDCFQKVVTRGQPIAEPKLVTLASGGLAEDFAYGALSNAAAKAAYSQDAIEQDKAARSQGTCSCTDTVTVVLTSNPSTQTWAADAWDQTTGFGMLYLWYDAGSGINQFVTRRVVSNTSKSSGGTSTFTLDMALPATNYNRYILYGISSGASLVYRKYKVVDPDIAAAMTRQFTYGAVWVAANGDNATRTSAPMGSAGWSITGSPPLNEITIPITFDPATGNIIFAAPTYKMVGNHDPSDVRVLLAVNTGVLTSVKPASGFEGTSYTVEGMEETLTLMVDNWRDPANQAPMDVYTQDMLDSVKDTVLEGAVVYHGLFKPAFTFGLGLSITGSTYTTGWESLNIPIVGVDLTWNSRSPSHYTTTMAVSNRRSHLTTGALLPPSRPMDQADLGFGDGNKDEAMQKLWGDGFGEGNSRDASRAGNAMQPQAGQQADSGSSGDEGGGDSGFGGFGGGGGSANTYQRERGVSRDIGERSSTPGSRAANASQHQEDLQAQRDKGNANAAQRQANLAAARQQSDTQGMLNTATGSSGLVRGESPQHQADLQAQRDRGNDNAAMRKADAQKVRDAGKEKAAQHQADLEDAREEGNTKGMLRDAGFTAEEGGE